MARLIAFYLPQFHPIPENDIWWGKGFTEWSNVTRARPWFSGHEQPQLPADLGFYDLRVDEVREEQARLAERYGISGFCYYYYWFNGRKLLERPLEALLKSEKPNFPFCICWANESWSRRWDGSEQEVLMEQVHSPESDRRFIQDIIPILRDSRYIRVDGAPLLLVYRFTLMPDPVSATETWRKACVEAGIGKIHISAVQSFGIEDPRIFGCDSATEFPPHGISASEITKDVESLDPEFAGKVFDYRDLIAADEVRVPPPYQVFPAVMPSWDNTARRGARGHVFHNATPQAYEIWLRNAINRSAREPVSGESIVFINAWNEWAEGTHLEPDKRWGHAFLEATRRALSQSTGWRSSIETLIARSGTGDSSTHGILADLAHQIESLEAANAFLKRHVDLSSFRRHLEAYPLQPNLPSDLLAEEFTHPALINVDQVNHAAPAPTVRLRPGGEVYVKGWSFTPGLPPMPNGREVYIALFEAENGLAHWSMLTEREVREDVAAAFPQYPSNMTSESGFSCVLDVRSLSPGRYKLAIIERGRNRIGVAIASPTFEVR
ncbi:MAG: glycoside hydrolase family 99-like domain-containing protein [Alphaproteobacteria bacterium]|nr:glycoside hydrolase family 99-like domain-containing protein [Alphaproteobacteria bacterium]